MIDTQVPNVVTIELSSDVCDFQLDGALGWQDRVNLSFLPQYPLSRSDFNTSIIEVVKSIGLVSYNNWMALEPELHSVQCIHDKAVGDFISALNQKSFPGVFVYSLDDEMGFKYEFKVTVKERIDGARVQTYLK